ncbi:hypothetical protein PHYBLDRAFT_182362 [Phycomyces blakesleeanus NRRL 1555(-)]|uniref:Uncharacterized protein n=1 Tax=Phycomyces blakesleeanus (strain ATCC 8743b / DSM 1359 / FGSC 10004 / NBRC 33097 / NRRL 1555) TaxID=763407 RepID=A0A167LR58_PHYB8|nr:hypothetical protein PHYBLDRAFT_182362 [Phycomyces blakesleeanus NRRL 1555(-)]OAD70934.1 hypothetical protein PHYBLDRAFT_182362 [Phycomyces blakesleeanus NRRL 1555(-)]|eukprot:XP_018288974.1 hypothetical protein PHYBLDRAFT_182362 [Phycomyces blakesleeanus NRRL 1555(-)]
MSGKVLQTTPWWNPTQKHFVALDFELTGKLKELYNLFTGQKHKDTPDELRVKKAVRVSRTNEPDEAHILIVYKSCKARGNSTKRSPVYPNHDMTLLQLLNRDLGPHQRYTLSITLSSFILNNVHVQRARDRIVLQSSFLREVVVLYGRLTIVEFQHHYPRLQHLQTLYTELIQTNEVNLTVNLNGLKNYGAVVSSACKTIAITYNNYYNEFQDGYMFRVSFARRTAIDHLNYVELTTNDFNIQEIAENCRVCTVDPGRRDAFKAYYGDDGIRCLTRKEYYSASGSVKRMINEDARKVAQGIKEVGTYIPSVKTTSGEQFLRLTQYIIANMPTLFNFYNFRVAEIYWKKIRGRQKALDNCANILIHGCIKNSHQRVFITGNVSKMPLIVFGNGLTNKSSVRFHSLWHGVSEKKLQQSSFVFVMFNVDFEIWSGNGKPEMFNPQPSSRTTRTTATQSATMNVVAPHSGGRT